MDNASKALVMAGAILIAVMLISLGVLLFNQTTDMTSGMTSQVDTMALAGYNKNYENYAGMNKSASEVRALLGRVRAHNNNIDERTKYGCINTTLNGTAVNDRQNPQVTNAQAISTALPTNTVNESQILDSSYYQITINGYNTLGAVSSIIIHRQTQYIQN